MKKVYLSITAMLILFSCQKEDSENIDTSKASKRICATQEVLERQLQEDPALAISMNQIEKFTENSIASGLQNRRLANGSIEIPIVVNIIYRTTSEKTSVESRIQSQIDVLNKDFNAQNTDLNRSDLFNNVKANVGITFVLDQVISKSSSKTSWGTRDDMKKSKRGGINPTNPTTKLNIWCCTIGGGILGYAQFPGGSSATDGIVIDSKYFGVTSDSSSSYPYNMGRTATHEVGHWLNLRHIWGDATCGNDQVNDTPSHNTANYGDPVLPHYSTCSGTPVEMTMNYMDYTDDRGMYMFSTGQKARMDAIFISGGPRFSFAQP